MTEINDHCQCDNCSGRDCGQDDPDLYLEQKIQDEEKHDEQVRKVERERIYNHIKPFCDPMTDDYFMSLRSEPRECPR